MDFFVELIIAIEAAAAVVVLVAFAVASLFRRAARTGRPTLRD